MNRSALILFLFLGTFCNAGIKLGLTGNETLIENIKAEFPDIEFLDRVKTDKIPEGTPSGNIQHADLIAIVSESSFVVFDAKRGILLLDADLPSGTQRENAVRLLRIALSKYGMEKPLFLSLVSVRDAGVPVKYKQLIQDFTRSFIRSLSNHSEIQILERSNLDKVLEERNLSGSIYPLAPAAHLLHLDFEGGAESTVTETTLTVTDAAGKELFRHSVHDTFRNQEKSIAEMQEALYTFLKVPGK